MAKAVCLALAASRLPCKTPGDAAALVDEIEALLKTEGDPAIRTQLIHLGGQVVPGFGPSCIHRVRELAVVASCFLLHTIYLGQSSARVSRTSRASARHPPQLGRLGLVTGLLISPS